MVGISSLNLNNPFVMIMEKEYRSTRTALVKFTRKTIVMIFLFTIIDIILGILSKSIILMGLVLISFDCFTLITLSKTIKNTNLRKVDEIVFGEEYNILAINESDVYNTTRTLCEMRGKIEGRNDMLNYAIISNIIVICYIIIEMIIFLL